MREASLEPNLRAFPTRQELASRLDDPSLTILDVRREEEYTGKRGSACDPRQGHIPGAKRVEVETLFAGRGRPLPPEQIRELVGAPEGAEIVAYCHSGSRSALATLALRAPATTPATTPARGTSGPPPRASARALARRSRASTRSAASRNAPQSVRPSSFHAPIFAPSPRAAPSGVGRRVVGSAIQPSSCACVTSGWNCTPQHASPRRNACVHAGLRASSTAPSGTRTCSGATGAPRTCAAARRARDRRRRRRQLDVAPADLRPGRQRPTHAPAARASSCAPRQTPSTGVAGCEQLLQPHRLLASHGWCSSWSACIAPPNTSTAS